MKKKILTLGMVLALVSVLVAPGAVLATTEVTGTVIEGYTFSAPDAIGLGDMTPGTPKTGNSAGSLEGNNPDGYTVKGIDDKGSNTGYMVSGTDALTNMLQMGPDAGVANTAATETTFLTTGGPGSDSVPFYVSQEVTYDDLVQSGYTITITFTVTQNT